MFLGLQIPCATNLPSGLEQLAVLVGSIGVGRDAADSRFSFLLQVPGANRGLILLFWG